MALRVQESGRIGWYYRVLEPGFVAAGDSMDLIDRCTPDWTIERLWYVFYVDPLNFDELAAMSVLPSLPEDWRRYAQRRLATRVVEDWAQRLKGD
jgi:MOSC domain-containing protein YiiM